MLFRPGFTSIARGKTKKLGKVEQTDIRESLIANSMHAGVLACMLAPILKNWGYLAELPDPARLGSESLVLLGSDRSSPELRLVRAYFSYQDHRGGKVSHEAGPVRMRSKPMSQSIDARQWAWKVVLSCTWDLPGDHINSLEARALLLALRWRARSSDKIGERFLHLVDSKVALGAFTKHRSNSRSFNYLVTRSAALQLAASLVPVLAHVRSKLNPADYPSRVKVQLHPCVAAKGQHKRGASSNQ